MTYRASDSSSRDCYSQPQSRLNQQIRCDSTDEGCPVIEESGTVCGETNSLGVFQEFRQMYDDCLKKLEGTQDGSATLRKLTPFKKLIDDLWEQNTMLVETVEELEQEATCTVTNLQDRLNKSCQKMCEYEEDIKSLTEVIQRYCECGVFDTTGLKFNTVSPEIAFSNCQSSCPDTNFMEVQPKPELIIKSRSNVLESICEEPNKSKGLKFDPYKSNSKSRVPMPKRLESSKTKNKTVPKSSIEDFLEKSLLSDICNENKCYCSDIDEIPHIADEVPDEINCSDAKGMIKINFNLRNDSCVSSSDCCCSCSCTLSSKEADDC